MKQLCLKNRVGFASFIDTEKSQIHNKAKTILSERYFMRINQELLCKMKGIDYHKVDEYLSRLKKVRKRSVMQKTQQSFYQRDAFSRQDCASNSELDFKVRNTTLTSSQQKSIIFSHRQASVSNSKNTLADAVESENLFSQIYYKSKSSRQTNLGFVSQKNQSLNNLNQQVQTT